MQWNPACSYVGKQEIQRSPLRVVSVENKRRASMGAYYYASNFNLNAVPYRDCHGGSAASELRVVNFQQREVPLPSSSEVNCLCCYVEQNNIQCGVMNTKARAQSRLRRSAAPMPPPVRVRRTSSTCRRGAKHCLDSDEVKDTEVTY